MRYRILALALVAVFGVSIPLIGAPSVATAAVRMADDTTPNPGGWSEYKFSEYIRKMTQPMDPTKPRKFYNLTPSASKFRGFMINTLGSVLGAAAPGAWQAEQMANKHKYDHSWEKFEQDFQSKSAGGAPQSYDDYVLGKKDWKSKNQDKIPRYSGPPATKPNTLRKGINKVGGGLLGLTVMPMGFQIGNGIAEVFGFSASEQELCTLDDSPISNAVGMISGVDCSAWAMTEAARLQANADQSVSGTLSSFGFNVALLGTLMQSTQTDICTRISGAPGGNYTVSLRFVLANGTVNNQALPMTSNGGPSSRCALAYGGTGYHIFFIQNSQMPVGKMYLQSSTGLKSEEITPTRADPERTLSCSVLGSNGQTYTAFAGDSYTESSGTIAAPECPALPEGVTAQNVKIADNQGNDYLNEPTTQPYRDWSTAAPDCKDGSCPLDLLIYTTERDSVASCFDLGAGCDGWFEAPDRDTRFECRYGGKKVDLKECYAYAAVFNESRQQVGAPYSDPKTGVWTGGQSSPTQAAQSMNQPVQNPESSRKCLEKGWAQANPVEWVLVPVKCALEWAFVPRATVVQLETAKTTTALEERAPGQLMTVASNWNFNPSMSGCRKDVTYPSMYPGVPAKSVTLWNACAGGQQEQLALWSRWIVSLGMVVLVVLVLRRSVAGSVDYKA